MDKTMVNKTLLLLWLIIGLPTVALAGLGGGIDSFENGLKKTTSMQHSSTTPVNYSVHQMQDNAGNLITEYVNANGVVFALTWRGPFQPDLHQLLGSYFKTYVAAQGASVGRKAQIIKQDQVVIVSEGRLRNFHGNAYVPHLVPRNFSLNDLN